MYIRELLVMTWCVVFTVGGAWAQQPALEVYGALPSKRDLSLSPTGSRFAYFQADTDGQEAAFAIDLATGQALGGVNTSDVRARTMHFATEDHLILRASKNTQMFGFKGRFDFSAAFSYNLKTKKIRQLLRGTEELFPAQSGLGRIVGVDPEKGVAFMPAFVGSRGSQPVYSLLRVDLDSGRGRVMKKGRSYTLDWFVDAAGKVIAREDYNDETNEYSIWEYVTKPNTPKKIYSEKSEVIPRSLVGVKQNDGALIISQRKKGSDTRSLVELSFDGNISAPIFSRYDADVGRVILDRNRVVYGVEYTGTVPTYDFFDPKLTETLQRIANQFPGAAISLSDWSRDFKTLAFKVSGSTYVPTLYLMGMEDNKLLRVSETRTGLKPEDIGETFSIEYKSRDGVAIPTILTLPVGYQEGLRYPTIVMPHGGPEAHDQIGFDWLAQFFANRGYLVLQPNFRGSSGFGSAFTVAGYGQWGRGIMQHDVTDGLKALIGAGYADPSRVCIVGGSYGGYAALAGGAFTPELYQCVVAIAPVSDLPRMLKFEEDDSGRDSWVVAYWQKVIGDRKSERERLADISPVNFAEDFMAPVLLVHGARDLVVPIRQSTVMKTALEKAGKDVSMVRLKGEDHFLSTTEMRIEALRAIAVFVDNAIGDKGDQAVARN